MYNKLNRMVSMILVIFTILTPLLFTASVSIHAESETETQKELTAYYNLFASEIIDSGGTSSSLNNTAEIELSIESDSSGLFCGNGIVLENNSALFAINFEGMFMNTTVTTKSVGINTDRVTTLYGEATGFVSDSEDPVVLTLYHIPQTDYTFVFLAVGANSETNTENTYVFGTVFGEMNETTTLVNNTRGICIDSPLVIDENELLGMQETSGLTIENIVSDELPKGYDPHDVRWQGSVVSKLYYQNLPVIAVSLFTPDKTEANLTYSAFVKINADENNIRRWVQGTHPGALYAVWVDSGTCTLYAPNNYSNNQYLRFFEPDPDNQSFAISLHVPSWIIKGWVGYIFDIIDVVFNLVFSRIKVTLSKYAGTTYINKAYWVHNYRTNIAWSGNPASSKVGYPGRVMYSFHKNTAKDFTIAASGSVHYWYTKNLQSAIFNGGGTINSSMIVKKIIVEKK